MSISARENTIAPSRIYDRSIELDPKFAVAYENRGGIYSIKEEYDRAIADYDQAIKLSPNLERFYYNRGNVRRATAMSNGRSRITRRRFNWHPTRPAPTARGVGLILCIGNRKRL
jgi:tetratricopeptide (TPR) repeat protein